MRVLLFAGKGGAGTTTVAAATAVATARHGIKTLLLAGENPEPLLDLLETVTQAGLPQEVEPSLSVLRADPAVHLARSWPTLQRYLRELPDGVGAGAAEAAAVLSAAGARPLMSLLALRDEVRSGPWDLVVVDAGTGQQLLRLLTVADELIRVVDVIWSPERRLGLLRRRPHPVVTRAVARLRGELEEARSMLRSTTTSTRLVLAPDRASLAHARHTMTAVTVHGFAVDGVVANRIMADGDSWPAPLRSAQQEVLGVAASSFAGADVALHSVPHLGVELAASELAALADPARGAIGAALAVDELLGPLALPQPRVCPVGEGFELALHLPFASAADVELTRDGDDLHLVVAGTRRVMVLPPVLRRCVVRSAAVAGGQLVVRFDRDPALWPQRDGAEPEPVP